MRMEKNPLAEQQKWRAPNTKMEDRMSDDVTDYVRMIAVDLLDEIIAEARDAWVGID